MKKIIRFSVFCFITSILFTSCKSSMSVTKRRYNSGYYVAYNSGRQNKPVLKKETKTVVPALAKASPLVVLQEPEKRKAAGRPMDEKVVKPAADNNTMVASTGKKQYKSVLQQHVKQIQSLQTKTIENHATQFKHKISKTKKSNAVDDEDALSLFWIVILVILILWAIGALAGGFGLGGFINLLLVVALILLILWLLRLL